MAEAEKNASAGRISRIPSKPRAKIVSDELQKISALLVDACPSEAIVSFSYEGELRVHIDVRNLEHVTLVEAILPTLGAGLFNDIRRGSSPEHPFFHRVTADVDR
ncbi:hypothetical protein ACFB49_42300 [Sphingomonas sp. DBB INV C78]|uniref:hypothetical protein n=1 Tax=Sphingomonas sp. DBB INV C78 TaxID=3349434 RepID=UPI0036D239A6